MAVETEWVGYGEAASAALGSAVRRARRHDPLAPVTVITPTPAVAVATRRDLAARLGGMLGVGFHSLGAVAELLAAPRLAGAGVTVGADRELAVAAVRTALADRAGPLGPIAGHRATWEAVADTVAELETLDDGARARVRAVGGLPAEMVRVHDAVVDLVGPTGPTAVWRLAARAVTDGGAGVASLGTVVVHLPDRLPTAGVDLLRALAEAAPVVLLLGTAGHRDEDLATAEQLAPLGVEAPDHEVVDRPVPTAVVSANDVDDEVRAAVRRLLALADDGTPLHRMAVVHPSGAPYARVVDEVLTAAGVPHTGPSTQRLAQSAAGRVLLGVLEVARSGFARQDVVDLWGTGLVVDDDGRPVPAARFDDLSRRLGVVRGADRWRAALDARRERLGGPADDGAQLPAGAEDQLTWLDRLGAAFDVLQRCVRRPATWDDVAEWAAEVLDGLCGPAARRTWPDHELDADVAIRTALGRLDALAAVEPEPSDDVVHDTIRTVLDAPAPRRGRPGVGVLVTTLDQPPVVPLDAVAVVGLVEGHAPRTVGDDVLLGDELRREVGLTSADDHHRAQRRSFHAALASAGTWRLLTHARNDQRSGRSMVPSRWLVDAVEQRSGHRPDTARLMAGAPVEEVHLVASHSAGLAEVARGDTTALHAEERTFAALVEAGGLDHPAGADPGLAAGLELLRGRAAGDFTRFDGNLGGHGVDITQRGALSPTSLETYAACPRRWFFAHGLGLRPLERPEEIHRIQPRDRGTLVHTVLERFFGEAIAAGTVPPPGHQWPDAARERLTRITHDACAELESLGLTGHPRWWEHDRAEIHLVVHRALDGDVATRAALGTMPVAVELTFGRDGVPPLDVDLGDGRVLALAGQADRVDVGDGVVAVWDYKYGGTRGYDGLQAPEDDGGDPLAGGTKLQLVAYGLAAGEVYGPAQVVAHYWFLKPPDVNATIGYPVEAGLGERFRRVLRVLVDGIGEGHYPARPGEYQWHRANFDHCAWCDFDAICPRDRDEEWVRVRRHPSLSRLVTLVEDGSSTVLAPEGEDGNR